MSNSVADSTELKVAQAALREAAALCARVQSSLDHAAMDKRDRSPVTVADFGSQALICRALGEAFPNDPVIAEEDAGLLGLPESEAARRRVLAELARLRPGTAEAEMLDWIDHGRARQGGNRFWTLDPIDGTKGFLRGDQYAISLALIIDGRIELGLLACPRLAAAGLIDGRLDDAAAPVSVDRVAERDAEPGSQAQREGRSIAAAGSLLCARRGAGTFVEALGASEPEKRMAASALAPRSRTGIRVSSEADPARARLCESVESAHTAQGASAQVARTLGIQARPQRIDSQAKYAAVAAGAAEAYLRLPTRPDYVERIWDHAGGLLLVTEAGGQVTDIAGKPLDFSLGAGLEANRGVLVSNRLLHPPLLEAIQSVLEA